MYWICNLWNTVTPACVDVYVRCVSIDFHPNSYAKQEQSDIISGALLYYACMYSWPMLQSCAKEPGESNKWFSNALIYRPFPCVTLLLRKICHDPPCWCTGLREVNHVIKKKKHRYSWIQATHAIYASISVHSPCIWTPRKILWLQM